MEYKEAVDYLLDIPNYAGKTTKENIRLLLEELGNPLAHQRIIHVAGTNGKGSVCAYLSGLLQAQGYTVGMFTSPHLMEVRERIRFNGTPVEEKKFCRYLEQVQTGIAGAVAKGGCPPSFFETMFLMAAVAFQEKEADYCIYEAGMGGMRDATNVVSPIVSIITTVSLEHTAYLGSTLEEIAREKAGIIKERVPVVSLDKNRIVKDVIRSAAAEKHAPCILLKEDNYLELAVDALYQKENASLAAGAMEVLKLPVSRQALERVRWPGRMEQILPGIYVDGAHNMEAIEALVRTLDTCHKGRNKVLLFSVAEDKNYRDMISFLCTNVSFKQVILVPMENPRGCDIRSMKACFREAGQDNVTVMGELQEAFACGRALMGRNTMLLCTGSLYFAGELMKMIRR